MERFDYVIVGAGSAGCVLAARLSEDRRTSVLLIEAGPPDRHVFIHVPAAFPRLFDSHLDWGYRTTPQRALGDRQIFWPRGRVVGGSSSLNAMLWVPGAPADYDAWGAAAGPQWTWASLAPYLRRVAGPLPGAAAPGMLPVSAQVEPNALTRLFLQAARSVGLPALADGAVDEGVAELRVNQVNGRRASAADAYLRPALRRANLTLRTGAHVHRILFEGRRAGGVAYHRGRHLAEATAAREVILCAGAIGSPALLQRSGVGDGTHLGRLGVEVVADRPAVGSGLTDHLVSGIARATRRPISLLRAQSPSALLRYALARRGPLTSPVAEGYGYLRSRRDLELPDLEIVFLPVAFLNEGLNLPRVHGVSLAAVLLKPASRGEVRIASGDPDAAPLIDPSYLSDARDAAVLAEGIRRCQRILSAPPLAGELAEALQPAGLDGEEAVAAALAGASQTIYHPTGTCALGTDARAVLDPDCRVRGTQGLRVVDASAIPEIPRGHTHAATVVLAERAADLILGRSGPSAGSRDADAGAETGPGRASAG